MTSRPIWELWMTLFVISHSHKPPALHVSHCLCASRWELLSRVSKLTPLFPVLSSPHIMTQSVTTWHVICRYTSVVTGSRCWLLRMSPIVPRGITQRYVITTSAETHSVSPIQLGDGGNVLPQRRLIYSLAHTQVIVWANCLSCHVCLNSTWYSEGKVSS